MRSLKNRSETLSCKIWFLEHTKIRLNPKDEPSISKIERVTWIFVTGAEAKSQCCLIFKYQNLTQFLRFLPNSLHVSPPNHLTTGIVFNPALRAGRVSKLILCRVLSDVCHVSQFLSRWLVENMNATSSLRSFGWMSSAKATYCQAHPPQWQYLL